MMGQWPNQSTEPSLQHDLYSFFSLTSVPVIYSSCLFVLECSGDNLQYQIQEAEADLVHGWLQHSFHISWLFYTLCTSVSIITHKYIRLLLIWFITIAFPLSAPVITVATNLFLLVSAFYVKYYLLY